VYEGKGNDDHFRADAARSRFLSSGTRRAPLSRGTG
jgi:hypothetical protein